MKHFAWLSAVLFVTACSPQVYPLYLDVRQPSKSGLDLARKSMGIVFMDSAAPADSAFDRSVASALARSLEEDYFGGEEEVGLYHIPAADSLSLDYMHSLVMDTNRDVVFVLSSHLGEKTADGGLPVSSRLMVYDSMGEDRIRTYTGSNVLPAAGEGEPSQAEVAGKRISRRFLSQWQTESFSFYYIDGLDESWMRALEYLQEGKMSKAMDEWMRLAKDGNTTVRACAAYNMAMAFYLSEDYRMSSHWLDLSDRVGKLPLSDGLHKRLANHLEKMQK